MKQKTSVVIIEDSALMRKELAAIINSSADLKVIGVAYDGRKGLEMVKALSPDVVTIDINMPDMDGLTVLQHIMIESPRPCVIISAYTGKDSLETFEALELGAVDFVQKPSGEISRDIASQSREIIRSIRDAANANLAVMTLAENVVPVTSGPAQRVIAQDVPTQVVVVGVSTGGPRTLMQVVPELAATLGAPVIIVQHMPENFTNGFAKRLDTYSTLQVRETVDGEELLNDEIYVVRGGHHLVLKKEKGRVYIHLRRADKNDIIAPSVDLALHSAIDIFGKKVVGVILTGMGSDGCDGMKRLHTLGGITIAESKDSAVIFGMPKEVIDAGASSVVAPADRIAKEILAATKANVL
jgi:two-component system chemotaxis response regulator CheB